VIGLGFDGWCRIRACRGDDVPEEASRREGAETVQTVLVVDDEPHIREVIVFALGRAGFRTVEAEDGAEAIERFEREGPDLVILDVMLPSLEGTDVCREIRRRSAVPILFLSSRDEEIDRVVGLELGGDDYVGKPFSPRELVARVRALLRRGAPPPPRAESPRRELRHGRLAVDLDEHRCRWEGREVVLTATELGILRTLLGRPGKVYSRDELMDGAYRETTVVSDRTIDSHVRRLRAKLREAGGDPVETVHGVGYKLGAC
jgi:two-component system, OmpR family, response regulator